MRREIVAQRHEMHADQQRAEKEQRRQRGSEHHLDIFDAEYRRHEKGRGPHDRRGDLATGRGDGLDCASKAGGIAEVLHHRDGERSGGRDIGHRTARHHAHEPARHDGDLGRAAAARAGHGTGHGDEEVAAARHLQHRAEHDEEKDIFRRHAERGAKDAFKAEIHLVDEFAQVDAAMGQRAQHIHKAQIGPDKGIGDKDQAQRRDHDPKAAAGDFERHKDGAEGHENLERAGGQCPGRAHHDIGGKDHGIADADHGQRRERDIGHPAQRSARQRKEQDHDQRRKEHMTGAQHEIGRETERRGGQQVKSQHKQRETGNHPVPRHHASSLAQVCHSASSELVS